MEEEVFDLLPEEIEAAQTRRTPTTTEGEEVFDLSEEEAAVSNARRSDRVFTGADYYEGPSTLGSGWLGFITGDADPKILGALETLPEWEDMEPIERRMAIRNATQAANRDMFEAVGEPGMIPGTRIQRATETVTDDDGNPLREEDRTYIVPGPGSTAVDRTVAGAFAEGGRAIANLGESITDAVGISDPDNDFINQNFPRIPSENGIEQLGQEIGSMFIGGMGGAKIASTLMTKYNVAPRVASRILDRLDADWRAAEGNKNIFTTNLMKWLGTELVGGSVGATLTTPDSIEPLLGRYIENEFGANLIENAAFTAGFKLLIEGGRGGLNVVRRSGWRFDGAPKATPAQEMAVAVGTLQAIDPAAMRLNLDTRTGRTRAAELMKVLGQVSRENSSFNLDLLATQSMDELPLDTVTAIRLGASDYVDRAYGFMRGSIPDWEAFKKERASEIVENFIRIKRGAPGADGSSQNTQLNTNISTIIGDNADTRLPQPQAGVVGSEIGESIAAPLREQAAQVDDLTGEVSTLGRDLVRTQAASGPVRMVQGQLADDPLGSPVRSREELRQLLGPQLFNRWSESYTRYSAAFENLPEGVPLNQDKFLDALIQIRRNTSTEENAYAMIRPSNGTTPFIQLLNRLVPDGATDSEILANLMNQNVDLKQVYNEYIPLLSRNIDQLRRSGGDPTELIALREVIYEMAEESRNPAFRNATDLYRQHKNLFASNEDLSRYEEVAKAARPDQPIRTDAEDGNPFRGQWNAEQQAFDMFNAAVTDTSGRRLPALIDAISGLNPSSVEPRVAGVIVGQAMEGLISTIRAGQPVGSQQLDQAIRPFLNSLDSLGEEGARYTQMFRTALDDISKAERGLLTAEEALGSVQITQGRMMRDAERNAFRKFVRDLQGIPEGFAPREMAETVFGPIFDSTDSLSQVRRMMGELNGEWGQANPALADMARRGFQGEFLRYMNTRIRRGQISGIGGSGERAGQEGVVEFSGVELNKIVTEADSTLATMRELFPGEERFVDQFAALLDVVNQNVQTRQIRFGATQVGSNTAVELANMQKQAVNRLIMVTVGVLNPTATTLRAISGGVLNAGNKEAEQAIEMVLGMAMSNPRYFSTIMDAAAADLSGQSAQRLMQRWLSESTREMTRGTARSELLDQSPDQPPDAQNENLVREMQGAFGR